MLQYVFGLSAQGENDGRMFMWKRVPKATQKGRAFDDYLVEDHADHVLGTFKTPKEAIDWAKVKGHSPLVARVRHLNDKQKPAIGDPPEPVTLSLAANG